MIWRVRPDLAAINQVHQQTAVGHLGIEFVEIGDDYLVATMPVDKRTLQPMGQLHGGASALLAETLGSVASTFCIPFPSQIPVGIELNASHLRPVRSGHVTGRVEAIRLGKRTHVWDIRISDDQGQLACVARLTIAILST